MVATTNNPSVQGTSIELLYPLYNSGNFVVNRKYQRKLVWNLQEKRAFIDSIIKGYPTPLILVAKYSGNEDNEIIDGLQRLNAVFSFMDGKYGLVGEYASEDGAPRYFDPEEFSPLNKFIEGDKKEYISKENCNKILRYVLPISTYTINESEEIEEVFRRINSNGRHLSKQEIRQAGSTNKIANLVRKISAHIRGDASMDDVIPLKSMQKISLTDDESAEDGIQFNSTFWLRQGILDKEWLRQSKDEEIVLDLLLSMLLGVTTSYDSREFDSIYYDLVSKTELFEKINEYSDGLEEYMLKRFSRNIDTFECIYPAGEKFSLIFAGKNTRVPRYFESLFFAIDYLIHVDCKEITDFDALKDRLRGIGEGSKNDQQKLGNLWIPSGSGVWKAEAKEHNFKVLYEILSNEQFSAPSDTPAGGEASVLRDARMTLDSAHIESARIEFKQGFSRYDSKTQSFVNDDGIFEKIAATAAAMSNTTQDGPSYIFVGICDDDAAAEKFSQLSGMETIKYKNINICGIEKDIEINGGEDKFLRRMNSKMTSLKSVSPSFVDSLISNRHIVSIEGRQIVMFKIVPQSRPVPYEDALYVRRGPENSKLGFDNQMAYIKKMFPNAI